VTDTINKVSSVAVRKATSKSWDEWLEIIDTAGGADLTHKEIVAFLKENHEVSPWWQQMITVGYEHARGKRVEGETAEAGFEIGVQKTLPFPLENIWEFITSEPGLKLWLGEVSALKWERGEAYRTSDGASGEVRVHRPLERIRLTWKPEAWEKPSTVQLTFISSGKQKTSVRFHHENIPDGETRETMRSRWKHSLEEIARSLSG
jgi:uncharacterized protein YndB with AHSA1/START domain